VQEVEQLWLTQALKGDEDAFGHLVETFQGPVFNLCHRMLGDAEEAEDASQETFLRAYRSLGRYDASRPFSTWLLSIAAHYCIDQIRRRRMNLVPFEDLPYEEVRDPSPNPETEVSSMEDQRAVESLLKTINPVDRATIVLYYWYDFSYEEIGSALHLTTSAVKSRLHRARKELASTWKDLSGQGNDTVREKNESPAF
jgi:RNA polymerase sigma-70 factor (ECF subfamily)